VIRIGWSDGTPRWKINDQPVESLDQVRNQLAAIAEIKQDAPVILHPDGTVPLGVVIETYDVSKLENFDKISFAVNPKK
jgi:biopolymer transport protein ExbD